MRTKFYFMNSDNPKRGICLGFSGTADDLRDAAENLFGKMAKAESFYADGDNSLGIVLAPGAFSDMGFTVNAWEGVTEHVEPFFSVDAPGEGELSETFLWDSESTHVYLDRDKLEIEMRYTDDEDYQIYQQADIGKDEMRTFLSEFARLGDEETNDQSPRL